MAASDIQLIFEVLGDESIDVATKRLNKMQGAVNRTVKAFKNQATTANQSLQSLRQIAAANSKNSTEYRIIRDQMRGVRAEIIRLHRERSKENALTRQGSASRRASAASYNAEKVAANKAGLAINQYGVQASRAQVKAKRFGSVGLQQVGYQVGDFAVQVQGGTNALVALGQQGSQLLGILGPFGAIAGAVLAIWTAIARVNQETSDTGILWKRVGSDLVKALQPIKPLLDGINNSLANVGDAFLSVGNLILNNLERAVAYTTALAILLATKVTAGFILSGRAAVVFFKLLKAGIISTGIGIFVVLLGEIILKIMQVGRAMKDNAAVIDAYGGAWQFLWDLVIEMLNDWTTRFAIALLEIEKYLIKFFTVDSVETVKGWVKAIDAYALNPLRGVFSGTIEFIKTIWGAGLDDMVRMFVTKFFNILPEWMTKPWEGLTDLFSTHPLGYNMKLRLEGVEPEQTPEAKAEAEFKEQQDLLNRAKTAFQTAFTSAQKDLNTGWLETFYNRAIKEGTKRIREIEVELQDLYEGLNMSGSATRLLNRLLDTEDGSIDIGSWFGTVSDLKDISDAAADALSNYLEQLKVRKAIAESVGVERRLIEALGMDYINLGEAIKQNLIAKTIAVEEIEKKTERLEDIASSAAQAFGDAFTSIVKGTQSVGEAFSQMALKIVESIWEVIVLQPIIDNLTKSFTSILNGGSFFPSGGNWLGGKADGGVVNGPSLFHTRSGTGLMGEAGPEAIMPLKRTSSGKLGVVAEGGGVVVNQYFNFSANGDESVKRIIAQEAPKLSKLAQRDMMKSRRQGGTMRAVFS